MPESIITSTPVANRIDDLAELVERRPRPVELAAAMITEDHALTADIGGMFGVLDGHDALEAERPAPFGDHLLERVPIECLIEHFGEILADRRGRTLHGDVLVELGAV